jgi:hypothetical protein
MKLGVFVHTNHKQHVGALVSAHSMRRNSRHADALRIETIDTRDHPFMAAREGQTFRRDGVQRNWRMDDLQSFTPLRFMPPELMGYEGRAVVVDPDVFAVGDIWELLARDMDDKAIMCRRRPGKKGEDGGYATSVMLLDCAKLQHWNVAKTFDDLFAGKLDYMDWIELKLEAPATIGAFEDEWNDFDRLTPATKMVHNTKRQTQPWKTGLPVDFVAAEKFRLFPPKGWFQRGARMLFGDYALAGSYRRHPDPVQERYFFGLLKECLENGTVTEAMLREEMAQNHVRKDALEVLARTPKLGATPFDELPQAA